METTIYKPSIYKGAGIYNTGAGGGGINYDYETDFSNFDFVNKVDIPQKGFFTFYEVGYNYSADNGLKITAQPGNKSYNRNMGLYVRDGSELEIEFLFEQNSGNPSFFWFFYECCFAVNTNERNKIIFLALDSYDFTSTDKLTYYQHANGYYYYSTNYDYGIFNKMKFVVKSNSVELYINNELLVTFNQAHNFIDLDANPRNGKYMILKNIKLKY